ncbi:Gar1/Naf1 RNA binding region-domain-containing protein [Cercophora newfieldiana]|uniref:H/ACA ribonucleoprotein complex non-core subunit NAF1 n=1 Tax=Cercophora newfieldiana TaxID=92897 RepID=A0AA40CLY9_9PEZI|nr:Gar1/Naf1 RNA binding region-domain-containing protein [Cercophora newfieldiana]
MADQTFQIPGLGHARPNETLPAQNFAPDLLVAAASFGGDAELAHGVGAQPEKPQQQVATGSQPTVSGATEEPTPEKVPEPTEAAKTATGCDTMDVDGKGEQEEGGAKLGDSVTEQRKTDDVEMDNNTVSPPSPGVADALEAALGMLPNNAGGSEQAVSAPAQPQDQAPDGETAEDAENPEWEVDSSPYESSSESDSSDSSSEDDSEDEGGYTLLGIEETARMLMAEEDGDGDDAARGGKGAAAALRTKNEIPDDVLPKPDVTITPEMEISPIGNVQFIVENTAVIKSQNPGEFQVLERGSVLCKEDRTVVGALTDILGNVRSPVYILRFATEEEIKELGLEVGTAIFYSNDHAVYAFTQELKQVKGTDASNLHDEEVGADEMEFSDDEKEAEYKRQQKLKRRGGKAGRGGRDQQPTPRSNSNNEPIQESSGGNLNYDDEDGPYKPLSRPSTFAQGVSAPSLPPKPDVGFNQSRGGFGHGSHGGRGGRGDFRGRNRGNNRGGDRKFGQRGGHRSGSHSFTHDGPSPPTGQSLPHPPAPLPQGTHLPPPPYGATPVPPPAQAGRWPAVPPSYPPPPPAPVPFPHPGTHGQAPPPPPSAANFNFNYQAWAQAQAQAQPQNQQYQYGQAASHPQAPTPPASSYSMAPVPPPNWPGVAAQSPQTPTYSPTNYYGAAQYAQQQQAQPVAQQTQQSAQPPSFGQYQQHQAQQPYWGQQGAYGQGQQGRH